MSQLSDETLKALRIRASRLVGNKYARDTAEALRELEQYRAIDKLNKGLAARSNGTRLEVL